MDDWVWIAIGAAVLLVLIAAFAVFATRWRQRHQSNVLRDRFGPEYDRVVGRSGRDEGEEALRERVRRHEELALRDVTDEQRNAALVSWHSVQMTFVESPVIAVRDGEHLVFEVLRQRGYPLESVEDRAGAISVEEPELAGRYRDAHAALVNAESNNISDMNKLRDALLTYRALLYRLVGATEVPGRPTSQAAPAQQSAPAQPASAQPAPEPRPAPETPAAPAERETNVYQDASTRR